MNNIQKLIQEHCQNGVKWKEIQQICTVNIERVISKKYIENNKGIYSVFSSQTLNNGIIGYKTFRR